MTALVEHLASVRLNALGEADRLLAVAGDAPTIAQLAEVEAYIGDADRAGRLLAYIEGREG